MVLASEDWRMLVMVKEEEGGGDWERQSILRTTN